MGIRRASTHSFYSDFTTVMQYFNETHPERSLQHGCSCWQWQKHTARTPHICVIIEAKAFTHADTHLFSSALRANTQ